MISLFSSSVKHAIQAMLHLANNEGKLTLVSEIAETYDIPKYYLAKLVQILSKHHIVKSTQGRNGGICLNKNPKEIKISTIVHAIEGPPHEPEVCVFGLDVCSDSAPCPIHPEWKKMKSQLHSKIFEKNLFQLNKELVRKHKSLGNK